MPGFLWIGCGLLGIFVPLTFWGNFLPALKASNWVLKVQGNRLYLMLRNYRNAHLPDDAPVVVSLESTEIESVGQQEKRVVTPSGGGRTRHWNERRLEIRLKGPVPEELVNALEAQPVWSKTWYGRKRNAVSPVSHEGRILRIMWSGPFDSIVPRIDQALLILGQFVMVHDKSVVDRTQPANLTDSEFDDHIRELCQAGNRMDAINLLRERRKSSLTEARRLVEEITG